ncbi:DNA-directed RNA polymerases I, II, and III subunit RPABC2 isoform X1 [Monodelphis domestica]|uniref:DNA-directed RNA polymerases I, II, and III subunit RPABC2 isoform X1 n=1 Tax=Monodelphis domestica TaxID=13616 RepID=UPI0004434F68|nr:DNA-directed RNA polymerases I, II, and III subunit RPABC2 isoform X1 [Monodelphis domestica]XP_056654911.1 DNA-directed RNA polymerases I, II, and III subunit RPABC2 isoform X1 [Monodelphis domestica]
MSDNEDNYDGDDFDDVEEDEGLDDLENPEEEGQENVEILPSGERQQANQKRITTPYMTKYERARVLGTRALQIASFFPQREGPEVFGTRLMLSLCPPQDVCPCDGGVGGGDGSAAHRHERTQGSKNPHYHPPLPARWEL